MFLEAADPGQALLDFFQRLGTRASVGATEQRAVRGLPLILISQLPRSGGSLLSQLLDGHPQFLVYPWEMTIGYPVKNEWPILDMRDAPDRLFAQLFDAELGYLARKGYRKRGKAKQKEKRIKFKYSPLDHYLSFLAAFPRNRTQRSVLDTYFDTFFRSWRRDPNDALYIAGFVPQTRLSAPVHRRLLPRLSRRAPHLDHSRPRRLVCFPASAHEERRGALR